jgi:hypothetical protein
VAYQPPAASVPVLGQIPLLFNHPMTKVLTNDFRLGEKFMCRFPSGQLYFESKLGIDTDGSVFAAQDGTGNKDGETTAKDANGNDLDADQINYFVLPKGGFDAKNGIRIGDIGVVIFGTQKVFACFGDRGPAHEIGEGSITLHRALGNEPIDQKTKSLIDAGVGGNGIDAGVITIVFPGSGNSFGRTNAESQKIGEGFFTRLQAEAALFALAQTPYGKVAQAVYGVVRKVLPF